MIRDFIDRNLDIISQDKMAQRRGRLLNAFLLVAGAAAARATLVEIFSRQARLELVAAGLAALVVFAVLYWFSRKGRTWPAAIFLLFIALVFSYIFRGLVHTSLALAFVLPIVAAPLIASAWLSLATAAVEVAALYGLALGLRQPLPGLLAILLLGLVGAAAWLSAWIQEQRTKDLQQQGGALSERSRELQANQPLLEARIQELERRSAYLRTSSEVARAAVTILETNQLVQEIVEIIRDRFELYYVGLFMVDETREWAVLRGGTGEAGQAMVSRGHKMRVGEGMIGKSISINEARILQDTSEASERRATPELPDTRSELALPLRSRDHVVGALTVQSIQTNAFDEEFISILQSMADQVAVALDNARLFVEAREALETTRRAYAQLSQDSWREYLHSRQASGMVRSKDGFALLESQQSDRPAADRRSRSQALPIRLRGQVIGEIELVKPEHAGVWTPEETLLLENLMDQLGATLESARLYQETQQRAAREQLVGAVTSRVRETLDIEMVLKTAVKEIRQALGVPEAVIRLAAPAGNANGNGGAAAPIEAAVLE